jgi:hypothetical protein
MLLKQLEILNALTLEPLFSQNAQNPLTKAFLRILYLVSAGSNTGAIDQYQMHISTFQSSPR